MRGLSEEPALSTERDAIRDGRLLLDDPDKVEPLVNRAADALRGQLTRAINLAALKFEPKVQPVTPPRRILRSEASLEAWVAEVRKAVLAKLPDGPVQL
jgi:hypothetical protein